MDFINYKGNKVELPKERSFSWRPSAYALIIENDCILAIKSVRGLWEISGGGIELGESVEEGLIREVLEETGYTVSIEPEISSFKESFFYADDLDEYYQSILMLFKAKLISRNQQKEKINFKDEVAENKWIPIKELKNYKFSSGAVIILEQTKLL